MNQYNNIQLLCICSNSESSIYCTIKSWSGFYGRICIIINNTTDLTEKEILRADKKALIFHREFRGFSETRNELIKLSKDPKYVWSIFIDDSFELVRTQKIPDKADMCALQITRPGISYPSTRIFKTDQNINFVGVIHETLDSKGKINVLLPNFIIYDRVYPDHINRTLNRQEFNLKQLDGLYDERSTYYKGCTLMNLGRIEEAKKEFLKVPKGMYYELVQRFLKVLVNDTIKN